MVITRGTKTGAAMKGYKDKDALKDAYERFGAMQKVADHFGVSKKLILTHMKRFGIERNDTRRSIDVAVVAAELDSGVRLGAIATRLEMSETTLRKRLREANVPSDRFHVGHATTWSGYRMVRKPDHPRADAHGYVREHLLVAEAKLGRPLADDEVVHHVNEIKHDNRPENLSVMKAADHKSLHSSRPRGPRRRKI